MLDKEKGKELLQQIKDRLQQVMREYDYNPTQLAHKYKVNQKTLNNHINGKVEVSISTILLVLDAFPDLSVDWLLYGSGNMRKLPNCLDNPQNQKIDKLEDDNRRLKLLLADRDLQIHRLQEQNQPQQKRNVG